MEWCRFPAGLLGNYYAARHAAGHYRSCAITGVYHFPKQKDVLLTKLLKWPLKKTIERHPNLCYGITEKEGETEAQFVQLKTINWDDVVNLRTSNLPSGSEDGVLSKQLGIAHQLLWKDQHRKPAWKFNVLRHGNERSDRDMRVDITYMGHHALGDGISCAAFHKTFFKYLLQSSSSENQDAYWPYAVPSTTPKPIFVEGALPFPANSRTAHQGSSSPPLELPWTANPPFLTPFISRVKFLTIPTSELQIILNTCHRLKITLTSLLHALIIIHLSCSVPSARAFRTTTPTSLRRFTGLSDDEIGNHISSLTTTFPSALPVRENSPEEERLVLEISKKFQDQVKDEIARVPKYGSKALNEIAGIRDLDRWCEKAIKGRRGYTYELSNVGAVAMPEGDNGDGKVRLEKLVFTQCGMPAGPGFGCSVVSMVGGPLVLSLHWQEGAVGEGLMGEMKRYLERRLLGFGKE